MKTAILCVCVLISAISCSIDPNASVVSSQKAAQAVVRDLGGLWTLKIENQQHQLVTTMTIRFGNDAAPSCMAGNWKRIIVESASASEPKFFPTNEPLSYEIRTNRLVIGRNEICDAYLHLNGEWDASSARGQYVGFGLYGGQRLGYFSLSR
jgi:hypothetical protein